MNIGTKSQVGILVLILTLGYIAWFDIAIAGLKIYALTGNPHSKRILGEYYAARAIQDNKNAADYFQQALVGYKMYLSGATEDQKKWIEFLIGNQYECGKGTSVDLEAAKYWYQQAIKNGVTTTGKTHLEELFNAVNTTFKTEPGSSFIRTTPIFHESSDPSVPTASTNSATSPAQPATLQEQHQQLNQIKPQGKIKSKPEVQQLQQNQATQ